MKSTGDRLRGERKQSKEISKIGSKVKRRDT